MSNGYEDPRSYEEGETTQSQPLYPIADPSFLKERINTSNILNELRNMLLGLTKNPQGQWEDISTEPRQLMSKDGIKSILSIVNFYVNTNVLFAELTRDDINNICYGLSYDLVAELVSHGAEWKIMSVPLVKRAIMDFIFATLTRAQGRGEATSIGRGMAIERVRIVPKENAPSRLHFWRKGGRE